MKDFSPESFGADQGVGTKRNFRLLIRFFLFLGVIITIYSVLFHLIMIYEGREFSWVTGFYWALTVMSTLGFGDITFHTDLGLLFTIFVLLTGVVFLLIVLPFSFIQFFWIPWLKLQERQRTPRVLPRGIKNHIIITNLDPITERLIAKLVRRNYHYVIVAADLEHGGKLYDAGYNVVVGEPDIPETFQRLRIQDAALAVLTNNDLINTNIAFTIREIAQDIPIVCSAENEHSLDILKFPGNTSVFLFMRMLGEALAERVLGLGRATTIISSFNTLHIAEIAAQRTSLAEKIIGETDLRQRSGTTIIGLWDKGSFQVPLPDATIKTSAVILLAGTKQQLAIFEEIYGIADTSYTEDAPVLLLGGGQVGLAAANELARYQIPFRVIEKKAELIPEEENFIHGDAADFTVLEKAGINTARTVIVTTHDDAMNIYLCFYCRQLRPDIQIICRATSERNVPKMHMAGADLVLSYGSMAANSIINLLKTNEISMYTEGLNIFSVPMPRKLIKKSLAESKIRSQTGCSVVAVKSADGRLRVGPDPNLPLEKGEELLLIGTTEAEKKFANHFL